MDYDVAQENLGYLKDLLETAEKVGDLKDLISTSAFFEEMFGSDLGETLGKAVGIIRKTIDDFHGGACDAGTESFHADDMTLPEMAGLEAAISAHISDAEITNLGNLLNRVPELTY